MATTTLTPEQDMRVRWLPNADQIRRARDLLAKHPEQDLYVMVPLVQPGKALHWWEVGQVVEHPGGAFLGYNGRDGEVEPDGAMGYREACTMAAVVAYAYLGERAGTVGYATIGRDGHAAVWEEVLPAETLLDYCPVETVLARLAS